ncbi:MAG: PD-(D/E)XK nuclease family protein, partial [Oscillospiraceae bacterium]|nr:PD-(D/E)XK nuclease family protein [Oscillospiraceae bacterium]
EGGFIIPDGGAGRRAEYSDIAILLRARTHATVYREELTRLGIPVESPDSEVFFDRPEIETALAFLSVIDNPRDDTALIAVLRSPVYAFTPDELAEIRLALPDGDFYDALEKHAATDEKSQKFITELAGLRTLAPELGAERALWLLYNKTELPAYISAESDGAARRGGLMGLIERARQASSIGRRSVFDFLRFVKSLRERGSDIAAGSPVSSSGGGAVRLMTAHKSKGLEFPIVFLADMSKRFNFTDSRERLLFHRELGAGPKRVDLERRVEYPTLPRIAIAKKLADETMSEEMRVLYVAMTRAREKLIITYASDDAEKTLEKLAFDAPERAEPISPYMLSRQRGTGDILLLAALTRPETRAILAEAPFDNPPRGEGAWDVRIVRMSTNDAANDAAEAADTADAADNERSVQPEEAATEQDVPPPFTYPYPRAPELPSKLTVTELKNRASDSDLLTDAQQIEYTPPHGETSGGTYSRPGFISPKGALTGAERGTALHLAMRRMALREYSDADEVRRELDSITAAGYLTPQQRAVVEEAKILRFLRSEYGARAARAAEVFREFKFSLFVPAEAYFPGGGADEIMLQGIVDLAFREGDKIIVVDFKTDRLRSDAALREKTALYTPQVRAYMSAMERVTGLAAREGVIYFFDGGAAVPV